MDKWNSIEELPLEEYDNPEEIPVEGVDIVLTDGRYICCIF